VVFASTQSIDPFLTIVYYPCYPILYMDIHASLCYRSIWDGHQRGKMIDPEGRLTTAQVATVLGIADEVARRWIRKGKIKGRWLYDNPKLGYRVKREDLASYLRSVGEEATAQAVESGELPDLAEAS
jgi:Helix-turn-helix domain